MVKAPLKKTRPQGAPTLFMMISSGAAPIGDIGPGLGSVAPALDYPGIPDSGKWVMVLRILLCRLEMLTVIVQNHSNRVRHFML